MTIPAQLTIENYRNSHPELKSEPTEVVVEIQKLELKGFDVKKLPRELGRTHEKVLQQIAKDADEIGISSYIDINFNRIKFSKPNHTEALRRLKSIIKNGYDIQSVLRKTEIYDKSLEYIEKCVINKYTIPEDVYTNGFISAHYQIMQIYYQEEAEKTNKQWVIDGIQKLRYESIPVFDSHKAKEVLLAAKSDADLSTYIDDHNANQLHYIRLAITNGLDAEFLREMSHSRMKTVYNLMIKGYDYTKIKPHMTINQIVNEVNGGYIKQLGAL